VSAGRGRTEAASTSGWYVYGVMPAPQASEEPFEDVAPIGDGVTLIREGGLAAIASEVPLSAFSEDALAENLRDPRWLEARVRAHESVLEAALGPVPVVPFRFGTIYSDEDQVRKMLREHGGLEQALDRIRGKVELGVKGFLKGSTQPEQGAPEPAVSQGRRYLEEKHRARRLEQERAALRTQLAEETHERLTAVAADATANALQPPEVSGREDEMFLNGAYLVESERIEQFRAALAALAAEHADRAGFELTGPWPPYNFVEAA
jgi:hypothetical protein